MSFHCGLSCHSVVNHIITTSIKAHAAYNHQCRHTVFWYCDLWQCHSAASTFLYCQDPLPLSVWPYSGPEWMSQRTLAVSSSNHHQRSGGNLADGHAIPGSGLLLATWHTPTLGFRKQERQLRTGSTGGCLQSIAQCTRSGASSYWIGSLTVWFVVLYM